VGGSGPGRHHWHGTDRTQSRASREKAGGGCSVPFHHEPAAKAARTNSSSPELGMRCRRKMNRGKPQCSTALGGPQCDHGSLARGQLSRLPTATEMPLSGARVAASPSLANAYDRDGFITNSQRVRGPRESLERLLNLLSFRRAPALAAACVPEQRPSRPFQYHACGRL
jgi:hypothetical protein